MRDANRDSLTKAETMATAANIAKKFWNVPMGVSTFESSQAYGVLNSEGTHALGKAGSPSSWGTKKTAAMIAEYADQMAGDGVHEWVPVFDSRRESFEMVNRPAFAG